MYRLLYWLVLQPAARRGHAPRLVRAAARADRGARRARAAARALLAPRDPALRVHAFGRELPGPLGLAAGFDKDAEGVARAARARLRLRRGRHGHRRGAARQPASRACSGCRATARSINRMGFNNRRRRRRRRAARAPPRAGTVGVNIGKTKRVAEADAIADFTASAERARAARRLPGRQRQLAEHAGPARPPGGREAAPAARRACAPRAICASPMRRVPLLVKIAPDLADADIDAVADLALELGLDGIIATNTTIARTGLATPDAAGRRARRRRPVGRAAQGARARRAAPAARARRRRGVTLIAVGGIETADDAWAAHPRRRDAGAGLHRLHLRRPAVAAPPPARARGARPRRRPRVDRAGDRRRCAPTSAAS